MRRLLDWYKGLSLTWQLVIMIGTVGGFMLFLFIAYVAVLLYFIVQLTSMPVENPEWSKTRDVPMIVDSRNTVYVETDGFDLYYGMPKLNGTP